MFETILTSPAGPGLWCCLLSPCCESVLLAQPWAAQREMSWSLDRMKHCSVQHSLTQGQFEQLFMSGEASQR